MNLAQIKAFLKPLYRAWMKFAHILGKINTTILLTFFYISFIGIARLFSWIGRKDLLDVSWKNRESYWKPRKDFKLDKEAFLKPY